MSLRLAWTTPEAWVERIAEQPLALLDDHAHCELRAAASAQALLAKRPRSPRLVVELGRVAAEEIEHFNRVVELLHARGGRLAAARENPYTAGLLAGLSARQGEVLLDRLLVSALIEARSLERFVLLARGLPDPELRAFYESLISSEAGHRALFVALAREHYPEARVAERLAELVEREARVIAALPFEHRMHSGPAVASPHPG